MRVDRYFRVFRNSLYPYIDVKAEQEDLTELVEIDDEPFILHPGEFVLGSTLERVRLPDDLVARLEGKSSLGRLGLLIHSTAGLHRPRLGRPRHARALERRQPADHDLPRHEDRPALVRAADRGGRAPVRQRRARLEVPGPARPDAEPLLEELSGRAREGPRHRRDRVRRAEGRARAARTRPRGARARPRPERARRRSRPGAASSPRATSPTRRASRARSTAATRVVHLVAIIKGSPADFERVMVGGTENLIGAAKGAGVGRFVLMSALGTNEQTASWCRTSARNGRWSRRSPAPASITSSSGRASCSARTAASCRCSSARCGSRR